MFLPFLCWTYSEEIILVCEAVLAYFLNVANNPMCGNEQICQKNGFSHIFSECRKQSLVWEWKTMQKNSHRFSLVTEHVICLDTTQRIHIFYSLLSCCWTPDPGLTLRSFYRRLKPKPCSMWYVSFHIYLHIPTAATAGLTFGIFHQPLETKLFSNITHSPTP